jgi:hypothetical protein
MISYKKTFNVIWFVLSELHTGGLHASGTLFILSNSSTIVLHTFWSELRQFFNTDVEIGNTDGASTNLIFYILSTLGNILVPLLLRWICGAFIRNPRRLDFEHFSTVWTWLNSKITIWRPLKFQSGRCTKCEFVKYRVPWYVGTRNP